LYNYNITMEKTLVWFCTRLGLFL